MASLREPCLNFSLKDKGTQLLAEWEEEKLRPRGDVQNLQDKKLMEQRTPLVSLVSSLLRPPWFSALVQFPIHLQLSASRLRRMNTKYSLKGVFMPSRQPLIWRVRAGEQMHQPRII